jgi:hypothetical protein
MFIKYIWSFITIVSSIILFLPYIISLIGLSSIGPISGGLFATMQGAGIVSGSLMAMLQSFAMSGYIVTMQLFVICTWVVASIFISVKKIYFKIY